MHPTALRIVGSTQPEIFKATVDVMALLLQADAVLFWQDTLANDGPIDVWVIRGERYRFNGNHRYFASL